MIKIFLNTFLIFNFFFFFIYFEIKFRIIIYIRCWRFFFPPPLPPSCVLKYFKNK